MTPSNDVEEAAREYRKPNWPCKSEWDKPDRYDTRMLYEIGDYVEEAFIAGYKKAQEQMTKEIEELKKTNQILSDSIRKIVADGILVEIGGKS